MKNRTHNSMKRLCALALSLLLAFSAMFTVALADDSAAITEDKNGVFLIMYCYPDTTGGTQGYSYVQLGSGFLVNETTLITCNHVVHITDPDVVKYMVDTYGKNWQSKMQIRVYYTSGNFYEAKEKATVRNEVADYTALELSQPLSGHKILSLRSTDDLNPTESVHALGFPYSKVVYEDANKDTLTSKDVNIESGTISKLTDIGATPVVNHSATLMEGMSGGPLVDGNGNVVGVNAFGFDGQPSNFYSVSIDQVMNALRTTATEYTDASGDNGGGGNGGNDDNGGGESSTSELPPEPETDFNALNNAISAKEAELSDTSKKYTDESVEAVKQAVEEAKTVAANTEAAQADVDAAVQKLSGVMLEEKKGPAIPMAAIIGIAVAVVAVIVIIIVLVARGKGKDDEDVEDYPSYNNNPSPMSNNGGFNQAAPAAAPAYTAPSAPPTSSPETDVLGGGSNETTVLSSGSNETTVLSSKPYGRLTRSSTGESVEVAAEHFIIGKERSKVSYCISNNGAISRTHAEITKSGGGISLIDKNSKNGTFLNGVKCESGKAVPLKDGDRITFADEEFKFNAL